MGRYENAEINIKLKEVAEILNNECIRMAKGFTGIQKNYGLDYLKISHCAKMLLDAVWGVDGYAFPIDIFGLLKILEIEFIFMKLNDNKNVNRKVGRMSVRPNFETGGKSRCIYIDSETPLFTQRFVAAHELAHLIMDLDNEDWWSSEEDCIMPMLPLKISELVADSFAIFLLIPMEPFFSIFREYVDEEEKNENWPIVTKDWLRYLSLKAQISYDYVAYAYEQLRYVAYWMFVNRQNYPFITDEIIESLYQ